MTHYFYSMALEFNDRTCFINGAQKTEQAFFNIKGSKDHMVTQYPKIKFDSITVISFQEVSEEFYSNYLNDEPEAEEPGAVPDLHPINERLWE